MRDVEGHRFLPAIAREVVRGVSRVAALAVLEEGRAPAPGIVAPTRPLDLDHLGAEVGEVLGGPGTGQHAGEIEDADPVEDSGHGGCEKREDYSVRPGFPSAIPLRMRL